MLLSQMDKYVTDADGFIVQEKGRGYHLMHMAAKHDRIEYIETNKKFVNIAGKYYGDTPLHVVVAYNRPVTTLKTLIRCGANIDAKDALGMTPLMHACGSYEQERRIESLLVHKADINADSKIGKTSLMKAAWFGVVGNVRLLVDGGAKIGVVQTGGHKDCGKSAIDMCRDPECRDMLERARKFQEST
ncbi:MAG: ankyrin repeat domain-containing protein [Patescibacteria group bacterium]|nr:ankyrin repeat domain-containing protein [Patescibacteria group bacterium]